MTLFGVVVTAASAASPLRRDRPQPPIESLWWLSGSSCSRLMRLSGPFVPRLAAAATPPPYARDYASCCFAAVSALENLCAGQRRGGGG